MLIFGQILNILTLIWATRVYSTYGDSPFLVAVYRTCCAKGSKAQSTVTDADPTHGGTRGFCLPVLAARHEHLCFPICTYKKKGTAYRSLPYP